MRKPAGDPSECDCYECVEARRRPAAQGRGEECGRPSCSEGPDDLGSWRCAFDEAYREVQMEIMKAEIKKEFSKTMEKTAKLLLETMMTELKENARRARFQKDLHAKLDKIVESAAGD